SRSPASTRAASSIHRRDIDGYQSSARRQDSQPFGHHLWVLQTIEIDQHDVDSLRKLGSWQLVANNVPTGLTLHQRGQPGSNGWILRYDIYPHRTTPLLKEFVRTVSGGLSKESRRQREVLSYSSTQDGHCTRPHAGLSASQ